MNTNTKECSLTEPYFWHIDGQPRPCLNKTAVDLCGAKEKSARYQYSRRPPCFIWIPASARMTFLKAKSYQL